MTRAAILEEAPGDLVIDEITIGATDVAVGDHVVSCVSGFCGACRYCLTGRPHLCDKAGLRREPGAPARLSRGGEGQQVCARAKPSSCSAAVASG